MKSLLLSLVLIPQLIFADFSDQQEIPNWANIPVQLLVEKGIIAGNADGSFQPTKSINRAEFCKMLITATGVKKYSPANPSFKDVEELDWFFTPIETAKHHGWVKGYDDGSFRPGNQINQAEIAKILSIAFNLEVQEKEHEHWYQKYIETLNNNSALPYQISAENFEAGKFPNRATVSEQLYKLMIKIGKISSYEVTDIAQKIAEKESQNTTTEEKETQNISETTTSSASTVKQSTVVEPVIDIEINNTSTINSSGKLYISKEKSAIKKITVAQNQSNIEALTLDLKATDENIKLKQITIRRVGNGSFSDFESIFIKQGSKIISAKTTPTEDLISIPLTEKLIISAGNTQQISILTDINKNANQYTSSRFVLFSPEWIDSNNQSKIGFFPIGGIDIEIK